MGQQANGNHRYMRNKIMIRYYLEGSNQAFAFSKLEVVGERVDEEWGSPYTVPVCRALSDGNIGPSMRNGLSHVESGKYGEAFLDIGRPIPISQFVDTEPAPPFTTSVSTMLPACAYAAATANLHGVDTVLIGVLKTTDGYDPEMDAAGSVTPTPPTQPFQQNRQELFTIGLEMCPILFKGHIYHSEASGLHSTQAIMYSGDSSNDTENMDWRDETHGPFHAAGGAHWAVLSGGMAGGPTAWMSQDRPYPEGRMWSYCHGDRSGGPPSYALYAGGNCGRLE